MNILDITIHDDTTQAFKDVCKNLPNVRYFELLLIRDGLVELLNAANRKNGVLKEVMESGAVDGPALQAAIDRRETVRELIAGAA